MSRAIKSNAKLVRFGIVGGINTALDFGLLFVFKSIGIPIEVANIMSTSVAFIFSFFMNKKFTFKTTGTNVLREVILFVVVTLFGLWGLQTLVIHFTQPAIHSLIPSENTSLFIAKLIATAVSLVWNYLLYDRFVFKHAETEA